MRTERERLRLGRESMGSLPSAQYHLEVRAAQGHENSSIRATLEFVLLYGTETWTMSQFLDKRVNGCYSGVLRMALNIHWQQKMSNADVFGRIAIPSVIIAN